MQHLTRDQHLFDPGPKRVLALDGGGVRGALTLGYLRRIEEMLRIRYGDPDFRLCDYFDLIGGTSTGAVIAASLALGFSVEHVQSLYRELGTTIFERLPWRLGVLGPVYNQRLLIQTLTEHFGDVTVGGPELRTGVAITVKRLDTGSPWLINNIPTGKYFDGADAATPNRDFLLRKVVRASTAVPRLFEPEQLEVAPGVEGVFTDSGAGVDSNPALRMLMLVAMQGYGLHWPLGRDNLLLVSVGTGIAPSQKTANELMAMPALQMAVTGLISMVADADWLVQTVLQWVSDSPTRWEIDSEIGDLKDDALCAHPLLSYTRYNTILDAMHLQRDLSIELDAAQIASLAATDDPRNVEVLAQIGSLAAEGQVREEHFPVVFDLPQAG